MLRKLKIKFVCINMLIVTLMLCIIFGLVLNTTKSNLEQQSIQMMQNIAINTSHINKPGMAPPDNVRLPFFTLHLDQRGRLIGKEGGFFDLSDEDLIAELVKHSFHSQKRVETLDDYALRYYRQETPFGQSIVFSDISSEKETVTALVRNCILIGFLSFFAFLGISILLANWAVRPVDKAWKQQRQFTADASHELKTPLTVIMTNAELMQSGEYTEEDQQGFLSSIITMATQMRGLVEQLLEMAKIDNATEKKDFSVLDFSELTLDAAMPFEPLFYEKDLEFSTYVQENLWVNGHASQLTQLIEIYLDNAWKYSYPNTEVTLRLCADWSKCVLSVQSQGNTISPEDLKHIFERFYRVDKARAMNHSYGLGLAIAETIAHNHKGQVWATSEDGVNTFYAQLPTVAKKQ